MPQQSIKNIWQTKVLESLVLSINFLFGRQGSASKALRFLYKPLPAILTDDENLSDRPN
ncbi:MAG: hypothetical protein IIC76_09550 [Bacteroidetes bacterium]|nr:hypothetical protein [Bacteroidota bacterium]